MIDFEKIYQKEKNIADKMSPMVVQRSYNEVLKLANIWIEKGSKDEKVTLLNYLIDSILEDICTSHIAQILYNKEPPINMEDLVPLQLFDELGNEISICTNKKIEVDLSKSKVYVCPWNKSRLHDILLTLYKTSFKYDESNHLSYFFTDLDFCWVYNGNHSICAGIYYKKGTIISEICDTKLLYLHCKTDGQFWYNLHTGEKLMPVYDFRFAAAFSIAQIRNKILKQK